MHTTTPTTKPLSPLVRFVRQFLPNVQSQQERDEIYLSESVDIYDLERRMRDIDRRGLRPQSRTMIGLGLR